MGGTILQRQRTGIDVRAVICWVTLSSSRVRRTRFEMASVDDRLTGSTPEFVPISIRYSDTAVHMWMYGSAAVPLRWLRH